MRKRTTSTKSRWVANMMKSMALKFSSQRKQRPGLVRGLTAVSDSPQRGQTKENLPSRRLPGQFRWSAMRRSRGMSFRRQ